jgi:hypothetical protein
VSGLVRKLYLRRAALRIALTVFEHRQGKYTLGSTNVSAEL